MQGLSGPASPHGSLDSSGPSPALCYDFPYHRRISRLVFFPPARLPVTSFLLFTGSVGYSLLAQPVWGLFQTRSSVGGMKFSRSAKRLRLCLHRRPYSVAFQSLAYACSSNSATTCALAHVNTGCSRSLSLDLEEFNRASISRFDFLVPFAEGH